MSVIPGRGLSWIASQEPRFPKVPGLGSLRLRTSWGSSGVQPPSTAGISTITLSSAIINGVLREQLGFKGVTVTDSLTAPAADRILHTATRAMLAGSDLLIFGAESASERGYATLHTDAASSPRLEARLTLAAARIRALKAWLAERGGPTCAST